MTENSVTKIDGALRKQCIDRLIGNNWEHCFVCGKPSDGEASQWHDLPLCAEENGNRCLHDFDQRLTELDANHIDIKMLANLRTH